MHLKGRSVLIEQIKALLHKLIPHCESMVIRDCRAGWLAEIQRDKHRTCVLLDDGVILGGFEEFPEYFSTAYFLEGRSDEKDSLVVEFDRSVLRVYLEEHSFEAIQDTLIHVEVCHQLRVPKDLREALLQSLFVQHARP